jgi:hypothetical protein
MGRWARQAREAANDEARYERVPLREQVRSRSVWREAAVLAVALGGAAWLGGTEVVGPVVIGGAVGVFAPRRKKQSGEATGRARECSIIHVMSTLRWHPSA